MHGRKFLTNRANQIKIVIDGQFRIDPTLNQRLRSTQRDQLFDFLKNLIVRHRISFRMPGRTVKSAKITVDHTGIGITNIAVNDKSNAFFRKHFFFNLMRRAAEP